MKPFPSLETIELTFRSLPLIHMQLKNEPNIDRIHLHAESKTSEHITHSSIGHSCLCNSESIEFSLAPPPLYDPIEYNVEKISTSDELIKALDESLATVDSIGDKSSIWSS